MSLPFADKKLGQHFLRDQKVIEAITTDHMGLDLAIIEVGPGPAILTPKLAARGQPFAVIEMDERFVELLEPHVSIIHRGDALKVDLNEFIPTHFGTKDVLLVSNLPYNVSVPLLTRFIETPKIVAMTLMFQKEVADKVFSVGKNVMGSLMALTNAYFEVKPLIKVHPGAFVPPPKVESAVLSFKRRETPLIPFAELSKYESFLRLLFSQKRKQMGSVLKSRYATDVMDNAFANLGLSRTLRAEALTLDQVLDLYRQLEQL